MKVNIVTLQESRTVVSLMHQSIVTTAPLPEAGWGIAGKMCRVFTFASSPWCQMSAGILFFKRKLRELQLRMVTHNRLQGQIAVVLPNVCPHSVGLTAGFSGRQVPAIPQGCGGRGAVVTNDWCINCKGKKID